MEKQMRKQLKVKFLPFWQDFQEEDNFITEILRKRYDLVFSEQPDYLFCPISSEKQIYYKDCVKILFNGENLCPDFNMFDYAIAFEEMTYGDRYLRFPCQYLHEDICKLMETKHERVTDPSGKKFCNFVYSNSEADIIREQFFDLLNNYKRVDSGGRYRNNVDGPCENKLTFQQQYKFSIAFENSSHDGYVTEKIVDAYAASTIPIYWGNPSVARHYNPKSFINVIDYDSLEDVIARVKEIDQDDELYLSMLKEPALLSEEDSWDSMQRKLEEFLYHIMDQPLEKAYRHNRVLRGQWYLDQQIAYTNSYHQLIKMKMFARKFMPWKWGK